MSGSSEMLVSWWSCCWIVCVGWAFPKLSPWLLGWADLSQELVCSLCVCHWSRVKSFRWWWPSAIVHRCWQSCGFEWHSDVYATSSALLLTSAEVHLKQTALFVFLRSLLLSVEERRAARAMWGLILCAFELCGEEERPQWGRMDSSKTWLACCFQSSLLNVEHCSAALTQCSCWGAVQTSPPSAPSSYTSPTCSSRTLCFL